MAFALDIRFIDTSGPSHRSTKTPPLFHEVGDIALHPTHNGRVSKINLPLRHHLSEVARTQLVRDIPSDAQSNNLMVKVATFEQGGKWFKAWVYVAGLAGSLQVCTTSRLSCSVMTDGMTCEGCDGSHPSLSHQEEKN